MQPSPTTIGSLASRALAAPAGVVSDLGAWVLVGPPPVEETSEWSFRTLSARTVRSSAGDVEVLLDANFVVFPLKKARHGPFAGTILVGRSRTNDVCVMHSSVSKLHARVRVSDTGLFLSDAGSSNGTFLAGEALEPNIERPLCHAMEVRFGACRFQVFEPQKFVELVARFAQP